MAPHDMHDPCAWEITVNLHGTGAVVVASGILISDKTPDKTMLFIARLWQLTGVPAWPVYSFSRLQTVKSCIQTIVQENGVHILNLALHQFFRLNRKKIEKVLIPIGMSCLTAIKIRKI